MGADTRIPTTIDRFEIIELIGAGGMGSVLKARDPLMRRAVAIKLLLEGFDTPEMRQRFTQEAQAAGGLAHPNIVTIFERGEYRGQPYIVMEFVSGMPLHRFIRERTDVSLEIKLELMEGLCAGLVAAHNAGVIHRDIKPPNLIVSRDGVLKIVDFGIARVGESELTKAGALGTVNYMAPEQFMGRGVDKRCDIFAAGAVFYELLSQRQAFPGKPAEAMAQILNRDPERLDALCPDLDREIVTIVGKALARNTGERYQDAGQFSRAIARVHERLQREVPHLLTQIVTTTWIPRPSENQSDGSGVSGDPSSTEQVFRRAMSEIDSARRMLDNEQFDAAIERLTMFRPRIALVDEAVASIQELKRQSERRTAIARNLIAARAMFDTGNYTATIDRAKDILGLDPNHVEARTLRDRAAARLEENRRIEAVVAEAQRIADNGAPDRALETLEQFQPQAPAILAKAAQIRDLVERRANEERRAQELGRRGHVEFERGEWEVALRTADEWLGLRPGDPSAQALKENASAQIAERERRRKHDARAQDAIRAARGAGDLARAIALLEQFSPRHPGIDAEIARTREAVRQRQERQEKEARRRHEEEEAKRQAAVTAVEPAVEFHPVVVRPTVSLAADGVSPTSPVTIEVSSGAGAAPDPAPAPDSRASQRRRILRWSSAVAALVVVAAIALWAVKRFTNDTTAPGSPDPVVVTRQPEVPAPVPGGGTALPDENELRLTEIRSVAARDLEAGRLEEALTTIQQGLQIRSDDPALRESLRQLAAAASASALAAEREAIGAGAPASAPALMTEGRRQRASADASLTSARTEEAVTSYFSARKTFRSALARAKTAVPPVPPKPTDLKAQRGEGPPSVVTPPPPKTPTSVPPQPVEIPPAPVATVPEPSPVVADKPVERPPEAAPPSRSRETTPPPAPIVSLVDPRPAIRQALRDYEAGYAAKDLKLLQRVWDVPPATQRQLEQFFPTVREYNVQVRVEGDINVSPDRRSAMVTAEVRRRINIGGQSGGGSSKVRFQLEERDGAWRISNINER